LSGQRLNEVVIMGRSGKYSPEILQYIPRILSYGTVGTIFFGGMFENDIVSIQAGGDNVSTGLAYIQANFQAFASAVDACRASGLKVCVSTVYPDGFYDGSAAFTGYSFSVGSKAFLWLNNQIRAMCKSRGDVILIDLSSLYSDPNPAHPVWPENTTTFLSAAGSGQQTKRTDNVHPNYSAHWQIAQVYSTAIIANFQPRTIFTHPLNIKETPSIRFSLAPAERSPPTPTCPARRPTRRRSLPLAP
jgi:hypothetical protein